MNRILCALLLVACLPVLAQQTQPKWVPKGAKWTGNSTLDLPVEPPKLGGEERNYTPQPDDDGDDPKDTPPPVFYGEEIDLAKDNLIYVVDRSGSMHIGEPDRLSKAKIELTKSIGALSDNISFEVYSYSTNITACFQKLAEATEDNKHRAIGWITGLSPRGGTATGEAMALALQSHPECGNYILLTDGAPNRGTEPTRNMIRENNHQGAIIDVFGIQAYGEFRAFCQGVASDSGGSYMDVP